MSTIFEYYVASFQPLGEHSSGNSAVMLTELLDDYASKSWMLKFMEPVSNGYMLVFEREKQ